MVKKNYDDMLSRFHPIPERYGRTDGRTELLYQYRASISRSMLTRDENRVYARLYCESVTCSKYTVACFLLWRCAVQSWLSNAALMQKYEIGLYLLTAARAQLTHCCIVIIVIFWDFTIRFSIGFAACTLLSGTSCTVSSILAILAPSHGILYCYDIPRYIVTLAILVSSRKYRFDDKYRSIVDIAQH